MYIHEGARPGGEPHTMRVGRGNVMKYKSSLLHQAFIEHECDWGAGTITVASEDAAAAEATIGGLHEPRKRHNLLQSVGNVKMAAIVALSGVALFPVAGIPGLLAFGALGAVAAIFEREVSGKERHAKTLAKAGGKGWIVSPMINIANLLMTASLLGVVVLLFCIAWLGWTP